MSGSPREGLRNRKKAISVSNVTIDRPRSGDILIVDDTPANLYLLAEMLAQAGYRARSAANGESALRSVQACQPALILLDVRMPDMDGFEVCRRLKESTVTRDIPVIFLSAATATADKLKAFKLGAADYITKPFHHEEVLARVRVHLTLSAAQEQLTRQIRQLQLTDEQLARDIAEHRGIQEDLEAALKRLQTLNVRITAGQEEERHKIAYELHEQLGQEIVSLKMHLGLLKEQDRGKEAQERLLVAQDIAKAMLERIRNMSQNLRPLELDTLDALGLFDALQEYCKQQADAAGWKLHFDAPQSDRPPRDVELACFRVVQDALANIAQHANATEVWLSVGTSADALQLMLRDDGAEIDAAAPRDPADSESLVLIGIEERVRQAGGSLEIKPRPGGGTEMHAVFPLAERQERLQE
jgi:signal transduction histidine kinase